MLNYLYFIDQKCCRSSPCLSAQGKKIVVLLVSGNSFITRQWVWLWLQGSRPSWQFRRLLLSVSHFLRLLGGRDFGYKYSQIVIYWIPSCGPNWLWCIGLVSGLLKKPKKAPLSLFLTYLKSLNSLSLKHNKWV